MGQVFEGRNARGKQGSAGTETERETETETATKSGFSAEEYMSSTSGHHRIMEALTWGSRDNGFEHVVFLRLLSTHTSESSAA